MYAIGKLAAFHNGTDLAALTKSDIEDFLLAELDNVKPGSVAVWFRSLRAFYNWMADEEIVEVSPMHRLSAPTVTDEPPPVLDDEQLRKLLDACKGKELVDRRDTAIIRVFCEPGSPRVTEMATLNVDDFDMARDLIRLQGKGDKVRHIPFAAKTGQALDRYLRVRAKHKLAASDRMWLGMRGKPMTRWGVAQMLERRAEAAGIGHVHPHQLRHTAAHNWADIGGQESDAMELFGWSSPEMVRWYGRSAKTARAHRAARRMSPADRL